ncbi:mismatch-specific DNA-glycosylase [Tumebacillus avium]|uniref:Mismatch-specific DNA-glycosylase n=1 Tax=Tumebacillus avium TaxID=1903704 RepID=A0A1Y0IJU7_9BACL|nr:mismatch-specific DNA-glycosylase [Tumebacillus avium]ARU59785.1 mismatch-specific DNA-glycosylase [Tumebacillus avium]
MTDHTNHQGIPDSITTGLRILFIGYNPSLTSGEIGHNYAGRGNRFWRLLHDAGLTPRQIKPAEDRDLLEIGYGFTNIVSRPTRRADEITRAEYAEGRVRLRQLIEEYKPLVACFVGKGVYEEYNGHRSIPWGVQPEPAVAGVIDFVAPSSSGLVRMKYEEILEIYRELAALISL